MSHELRTPLTAIIGYAEILAYEYFGPLNEKQKQQLQVILQASHHLLEPAELSSLELRVDERRLTQVLHRNVTLRGYRSVRRYP